MVDFASGIILALVLMDLVAHCVKIELVLYIVKMAEFAQCQKINVNVGMDFMALDAINGK